MAKEDGDAVSKTESQQQIKKYPEQRSKYEHVQQELRGSGATQISTSDPDKLANDCLKPHHWGSLHQSNSVDAKHSLHNDFKVTNENAYKAMGAMVRRANTIIGSSDFTALYDKGYHTGTEFDYAHKQGFEVMAAWTHSDG